MKKNNTIQIGTLFIIGAIAVLIPYTMLTIIFDYPNILRQDTGAILTQFHQGGTTLILTWFAFSLAGIPLIPAYVMLGKKLENKTLWMKTTTIIGVAGLFVQMIGLLRWTFVVPVLADSYVNTTDEATQNAIIVNFKVIHQFGGVLLGEHLGQLFTIIWTVFISKALSKLSQFPTWIVYLGYISSAIYLMAQAEILSTVIPGFPVIQYAGLVGSTLWLLWLVILGVKIMKKSKVQEITK